MNENFDPPVYEREHATNFVVAAYSAGYEPFHFKSRETLYFGPAIMVETPNVPELSEKLGISEGRLMVEEHGVGSFVLHPEQSAEKK